MMADIYDRSSPTLSDVVENVALVTPDDGNDLAWVTRAIMVTGGAVKVTTKGGQTLVLPDTGGPYEWPVRVVRVWATSTTATSIVALW